MSHKLPEITNENQELNRELEQLHLEFLDLFTRHKDMVENEFTVLTALYLEKLGHLQLELLQKQTEASRLKMKMNLIQAAFNRNEKPDFKAIDDELSKRMAKYYEEIKAQSEALDKAREVLSHLISEEDTLKLKEIFRVLCKKLHPDLNPNQSEEEKDLFIKVKAAYDLKNLDELQNILLFLKESNKEKKKPISSNEKKDRIEHLKKNIEMLKDKIQQLKNSFPFNMEEQIYDQEYISLQQGQLKTKIKLAEDEIIKYMDIISLMTDE